MALVEPDSDRKSAQPLYTVTYATHALRVIEAELDGGRHDDRLIEVQTRARPRNVRDLSNCGFGTTLSVGPFHCDVRGGIVAKVDSAVTSHTNKVSAAVRFSLGRDSKSLILSWFGAAGGI